MPQPLDIHANEVKDRNLTHTIIFGTARNARRPSLVAALYLDPTEKPWASFVFHYRSEAMLKAWDVRLPRGVGGPWHEWVLGGKSVFDTDGGGG